MTSTLSMDKRAGKVTDQEYQEVLTPLLRSELIEEVRVKLFPDLTFPSIDRKNSQNLKISDITREHTTELISRVATTWDEKDTSNIASIHSLFLVGARSE